mgnify:CR=1 FL=1
MLFFSRDLGIDLGTSNVLIYAAGRGIVLREPSVIALDKNSGKVLQVGAAARSMLGRTPGNVVAVHPLQDGVISDYELTARMLTEMLRRVLRHTGNKTADILLLLGVGALLVDGMLRGQRGGKVGFVRGHHRRAAALPVS